MPGPSLDFILGLRDEASSVAVSRKIAKAASSRGLGIIFGVIMIRRLDQTEGEMLDNLSKSVRNPLVFTVTSNPLATDAFDLFESELNPWKTKNLSTGTLLRFLDDLWSIEEASDRQLIILDSMSPSTKDLPRYEMNSDSLKSWIVDFYKKDVRDPARGGEGIFHII